LHAAKIGEEGCRTEARQSLESLAVNSLGCPSFWGMLPCSFVFFSSTFFILQQTNCVKKSLLFIALFCSLSSGAQLVQHPAGSFYSTLHAYSSQFKDAFSFIGNAASLAGLKEFSAGIFSERRYLLQELSSHSIVAGLPTASGNFGVRANYFGGPVYNETTLGFTYARSAGAKADIGVQFQYHALSTERYGAASAVTFDAGAIFHLTDFLHTGLSVYNPVGITLGQDGQEKLLSVYSGGIGYDASPQFFISAAAEKVEDQPVSVNAGFQYFFAENLFARAGLRSTTAVYYLGFGVKLKRLRLDATASFHPYLGVTPGLMLLYSSVK
jgi:hypothetical protein